MKKKVKVQEIKNLMRLMTKTKTEWVGDKIKSPAKRKTLPNWHSKSNTVK